MKNNFYLIVSLFFVMGLASCSKEAMEPQIEATETTAEQETPLTRSLRGAYYITSSADLAEFNDLLQYVPTLKCVLAYEKTELLASDLPTNKESISGVDMPNLKSVPANMFAGCSSLALVNLPECTYVGEHGFSTCIALVNITLPKCTIMEGAVFWRCLSLKTANLPKCVVLGNSVFTKCISLESVKLPKCTEIEGNVFGDCSSLKTVDLSSALAVGNTAFGNCTSLESINLPVCRTFGDYVFQGCTKLSSVRFWTLYAITATNLSFEGFSRFNYPILNPNGVEYSFPPACGYIYWKGVQWGPGSPVPPTPPGPIGPVGPQGEI